MASWCPTRWTPITLAWQCLIVSGRWCGSRQSNRQMHSRPPDSTWRQNGKTHTLGSESWTGWVEKTQWWVSGKNPNISEWKNPNDEWVEKTQFQGMQNLSSGTKFNWHIFPADIFIGWHSFWSPPVNWFCFVMFTGESAEIRNFSGIINMHSCSKIFQHCLIHFSRYSLFHGIKQWWKITKTGIEGRKSWPWK